MENRDEHCIWSEDQHEIFYIFTNEFTKSFKKDPSTRAHQTVPISKDITTPNNDWLIREATEDEIKQAVNQISHLNTPRPDSMYALFYHFGILLAKTYFL